MAYNPYQPTRTTTAGGVRDTRGGLQPTPTGYQTPSHTQMRPSHPGRHQPMSIDNRIQLLFRDVDSAHQIFEALDKWQQQQQQWHQENERDHEEFRAAFAEIKASQQLILAQVGGTASQFTAAWTFLGIAGTIGAALWGLIKLWAAIRAVHNGTAAPEGFPALVQRLTENIRAIMNLVLGVLPPPLRRSEVIQAVEQSVGSRIDNTHRMAASYQPRDDTTVAEPGSRPVLATGSGQPLGPPPRTRQGTQQTTSSGSHYSQQRG